MNREVAEKWIAALRSGEYTQGTECLRSLNDTFCCLGVLCDLAVKSGVPVRVKMSSDNYQYEGHGELLPLSVMKWSGVKTNVGDINDSDLTSKNDSGMTFSEIADLIEQNVEAL